MRNPVIPESKYVCQVANMARELALYQLHVFSHDGA
jgi:hypothetical protein